MNICNQDMNFTEHPIAQMKLKKISQGLLGATCLGYVEHIAQLAPKSNKVNYQKLVLYITVRRGEIIPWVRSFKTKRSPL